MILIDHRPADYYVDAAIDKYWHRWQRWFRGDL